MKVEDLTKFEGECPNIVVFGTYMDIRVPLTKKWKKIINERGDRPNTYHNCLISYISEQIALSGFNMKSIGNLLIKGIVFNKNDYYRHNDIGGFPATINDLGYWDKNRVELNENFHTVRLFNTVSNKDGSYIFILNTHGKYLTSFYASLNQKGILKIKDGLSAWENQIEKYRFATESERQKLVDALKASKEPKAKEYLKRFFGIKEEPKYEFKPFDKVLVRKEGNKKWNISLFAREIVDDYNRLPYKYECSNGTLWDYCIHFEGNECLLGTTENPEK